MSALLLVSYVAGLASYTAGLVAQAASYVAQIAQALPAIDLNDTVSWGLLAGVFTPLLTSLAQRPNFSKQKRTVVGVAVSILIGVLACLVDGTLSEPTTLLATVAAVVTVAAATYKTLWQPSGVAGKVELATSPSTSGGAGHAA